MLKFWQAKKKKLASLKTSQERTDLVLPNYKAKSNLTPWKQY